MSKIEAREQRGLAFLKSPGPPPFSNAYYSLKFPRLAGPRAVTPEAPIAGLYKILTLRDPHAEDVFSCGARSGRAHSVKQVRGTSVIKQHVLSYSQANAIKADFRDIYNRADPRAYYSVLGGLDYVIPEIARPIFLQLAEQCAAARGRPIVILDLGCSYGVNAALMRHGLSLGHLKERYLTPEMRALRPERLAEFDARYFSGWPARRDMSFIGLDVSTDAISYARRAGLLDAAIAIDLEAHELDQAATELVARSDLIISTGCVGYITSTTFEKLMAAVPARRKPWVASFVLRVFDYASIAEALARHGLITEKFQGATFVQRRFRDSLEVEETLAALGARGIDPAGKEAEGLLHAELFVSRPQAATEALRLMDMLSLTSGSGRRYGELHRRNQCVRGTVAA